MERVKKSGTAKGGAKGGAKNVGEAQGGSGRTVNWADRLAGRLGQVEVPAESRSDVSAHGFWKRGTTTIFDIRIFNLDALPAHDTGKVSYKGVEGKEGLIPSGLLGV